MEDSLKFNLKKVFLSALFLLLVLNVIGTVSENELFLNSTKPLFIPVFLIFYFIKEKTIALPFVVFLVYSFLGDSASMFFSNDTFVKASSVMYFLSYLCLVFFMLPNFKLREFNKAITLYLTVVVLINMYFLYTFYDILNSIIPDSLEVFLFGMKSISLIVLVVISFGVYLNSESKLSILFLIMGLSFVFSDVLNYVSQYYLYHWSFLMLDRIFHALGIFFLFNCIIEFNKIPKNVEINEGKIDIKNILA